MSKITAPSSIRPVEWQEVRQIVKESAPDVYAALDALLPSAKYPLFEVCYSYGATMVDQRGHFQLPDKQGQLQSIVDGELPKQLQAALNYNSPSMPLGLVLEGQVHVFCEIQKKQQSLPIIDSFRVFEKGELFAVNFILDKPAIYQVSRLWRACAGARTPYVISSLANRSKFNKLAREFNLSMRAPQQPQQHWHLLRELANHPDFPKPWQAKILFFGGQIAFNQQTPEEKQFRLVMYEHAFHQTRFLRNNFQFQQLNEMGTVLQKIYKKRFDHYISELLQHVFKTACGQNISHQIADARSGGPFDTFAELLCDSYGLEKHRPIILSPRHFRPERDAKQQHAYFSLALPDKAIYRPNNKNNQGGLADLCELEYIIQQILTRIQQQTESEQHRFLVSRFQFTCYAADAKLPILSNATIFDNDPKLENWHSAKGNAIYTHHDFIRACIKITNLTQRETDE